MHGFILFPFFSLDNNLRKDFVRSTKIVTFEPSESFAEKTVLLDLVDDQINEATEGFFAVLQVDDSLAEAEDESNVQFIRNGVALVVIVDDDRKLHVLLIHTLAYFNMKI